MEKEHSRIGSDADTFELESNDELELESQIARDAPGEKVQIFMNSLCRNIDKHFKNRAVIPERAIAMEEVSNTKMLEFLQFYMLEKLNKSYKIKVSQTLVREYYANLRT